MKTTTQDTFKTEDYYSMKSKLAEIGSEYAKRDTYNPFNGTNFMTDSVAFRGKLPNGVYVELSFGTGIFSRYIIGVTYADFDGNNYHDESCCCHSFAEVRESIEAFLEDCE